MVHPLRMQASRRLPFLPTYLSDVKGWIDPADTSALVKDGSNKVTSITDKISGAVFVFTGGGGGGGADWGAALLGGQAGIRSNYDAAVVASMPTGWPVGAAEGWLFACFKEVANNRDYNSIMSYGRDVSAVAARLLGSKDAASPLFYPAAGIDGRDPTINGLPTVSVNSGDIANSVVLLAARFTAATVELWKNGVQIATAAAAPDTNSGAGGNSGAFLFQATNGTTWMDAVLGQAYVTGPLTDGRRHLLEGHALHAAASQALLPNGHPFQVNPPYI